MPLLQFFRVGWDGRALLIPARPSRIWKLFLFFVFFSVVEDMILNYGINFCWKSLTLAFLTIFLMIFNNISSFFFSSWRHDPESWHKQSIVYRPQSPTRQARVSNLPKKDTDVWYKVLLRFPECHFRLYLKL